MKSAIKIFYKVETTGDNPRKHFLHRVAGAIEIDGKIVESFDILSRPHFKAALDPEALKLCGVTEEQILSYPPLEEAKKTFCKILKKHIDPFDPKSKAYLIGWGNKGFDDPFLRKWFELAGDPYFGSWFWSDTRDVVDLASLYLEDERPDMPNFKLETVASRFLLPEMVDKNRMHDAKYVIQFIHTIYHITTDWIEANKNNDLL